ncbi:MAG: hypothetical protein JWQ87_5185 [Candidatus Sulfotelmatobacter sp.]|nr:hypothetical protein [Candidatus Sulfotelmatobacter sp.]
MCSNGQDDESSTARALFNFLGFVITGKEEGRSRSSALFRVVFSVSLW